MSQPQGGFNGGVSTGSARRVLVVGLGSPDRGDDAAGVVVAALVAERVAAARAAAQSRGDGPPEGGTLDHRAVDARAGDAPAGDGRPALRIQTANDPSRLVDEMTDATLVIVVDAVRSGAPPGTVTVLETGVGSPPLTARAGPGAAATHGIGLVDALELARALDRMPPRVVLVGIEALGFDSGAPLSPGTRAGVIEAVGTVMGLLGRDVHEHQLDLRIPPTWLPHPSVTWFPDRPGTPHRYAPNAP